jgi:hypothetical protein
LYLAAIATGANPGSTTPGQQLDDAGGRVVDTDYFGMSADEVAAVAAE